MKQNKPESSQNLLKKCLATMSEMQGNINFKTQAANSKINGFFLKHHVTMLCYIILDKI